MKPEDLEIGGLYSVRDSCSFPGLPWGVAQHPVADTSKEILFIDCDDLIIYLGNYPYHEKDIYTFLYKSTKIDIVMDSIPNIIKKRIG